MKCDNCHHENLTHKEKQVLKALWAGHGKRAAACLLGITYKTIRNHLCAIRRKLGVHSTLEALKEVKDRI